MGVGLSSLEGVSTCADGLAAGDMDSPHPTQTTRTHLVSLSRAHNKFALALYQEFAKDGKRPGNFVLCTISVSLGLGMLYVGSNGPTQAEIHKTLFLNEVQEEHLLAAFAAMHWDILRSSTPKGCIFEAAIRLFAQSELTTTPQYEDLCIHYEISRVKQADFKSRPDLARKEINQWTEDRTHSKVKDVIPIGIVDRDTHILLLCAVYLKAQWLHPFDKKKTIDASFHLQMKETLTVRMMHQQTIFRYYSYAKLDTDILEMPFANTYMRLLLLLPKKCDQVSKLEHKLTRNHIETIYENLTEELVEVFVPKFRYEIGFAVADYLQKMGIKTCFQHGRADFTNLNGSTRELHVSRIFHHVCVEFDEGGPTTTSNGSASTSYSNPGPSNSSTPAKDEEPHSSNDKHKKIFRADRPFVFFVKDDRTGAILFMGRVVRPTLSS